MITDNHFNGVPIATGAPRGMVICFCRSIDTHLTWRWAYPYSVFKFQTRMEFLIVSMQSCIDVVSILCPRTPLVDQLVIVLSDEDLDEWKLYCKG